MINSKFAHIFFGLAGAIMIPDLLDYNDQIASMNKITLFFVSLGGYLIGVAIHGVIRTTLED